MRAQYKAFLLRLQRSQGQTHWRATLENAHTGELLRFATEREMLRFLMQVLTIAPPGLDGQAETNDKNPPDERIDAA